MRVFGLQLLFCHPVAKVKELSGTESVIKLAFLRKYAYVTWLTIMCDVSTDI